MRAMQHSGPVGRIAMLRALFHRFAILALIGVAVTLMILERAHIETLQKSRTLVVDAVAPILYVLSQPADVIAKTVQTVREMTDLHAENQRLREENALLLRQQTIARRMEKENRQLSVQMNVVPPPDIAFVTARVIADTGGAFFHSLLIDAGEREGVRKGQAAMINETLVGRVIDVGMHSSRVLLLTDLNSRIAVEVENRPVRAILTGDNSEFPNLSYVTGNPELKTGDRVVTATRNLAFPPGIPVGNVLVSEDGSLRVSPLYRRHEIDFITLVDYGLAGALAEGASGSSSNGGETP